MLSLHVGDQYLTHLGSPKGWGCNGGWKELSPSEWYDQSLLNQICPQDILGLTLDFKIPVILQMQIYLYERPDYNTYLF